MTTQNAGMIRVSAMAAHVLDQLDEPRHAVTCPECGCEYWNGDGFKLSVCGYCGVAWDETTRKRVDGAGN
jgi:hypothetical protein